MELVIKGSAGVHNFVVALVPLMVQLCFSVLLIKVPNPVNQNPRLHYSLSSVTAKKKRRKRVSTRHKHACLPRLRVVMPCRRVGCVRLPSKSFVLVSRLGAIDLAGCGSTSKGRTPLTSSVLPEEVVLGARLDCVSKNSRGYIRPDVSKDGEGCCVRYEIPGKQG